MGNLSSMLRISAASLFAVGAFAAASPAIAQDAAQWDRARQALVATQSGPMAQAIDRWRQLTASSNFGFDDYASFVLTYPGFPDEAKLRTYAEGKLVNTMVDGDRLIAFFDRYPPLTNPARAQYAIALSARNRPEAAQVAREAWRGGSMSATAEATLLSLYGYSFTADDEDARMDALLWDRDTAAASRQLARTSAEKRMVFVARLTAAQGSDPSTTGVSLAAQQALRDPGYVFNTVRQLRRGGRVRDAVNLLATRPTLASLPHDQTAWIDELLAVARLGDSRAAQRIAASADDAFAPGTDISLLGYSLRDDYTSLMWLGGTSALWNLGDAASAAPLFYRYGAAARTTPTRAKGFYWAGLAAQKAGDAAGAQTYFEMAAAYPDRFYGMLALERLGRPIPTFDGEPETVSDSRLRDAFYARPLTQAVREVARDAPWSVGIRFYREISSQAQSESDFLLVAELARDIGRRDLAVILGEEASSRGYVNFQKIAFPTMPTPPSANWTMVHAITRQESQFAQNAISHAGASGLMQLMPGTAREQAGKLGITYLSASVINDAEYNIRLGDGYFARMMDYYGGSYPLAVAAYNAGPGNVNKWLRANGDPRQGGVDWIEWIERIPIYETKNYVQRVLENAAVYEAMHPEKAGYGGPKTVSRFLGMNPPR